MLPRPAPGQQRPTCKGYYMTHNVSLRNMNLNAYRGAMEANNVQYLVDGSSHP